MERGDEVPYQPWEVAGRPPKLSPEDARKVRDWAALGTSVPQVAARFGVSPRTMREYVKGNHKRKDYRD